MYPYLASKIVSGSIVILAKQLRQFIKQHHMAGALSLENAPHHWREIRRLPAIGPRIEDSGFQRVIWSFRASDDTSYLRAQGLTRAGRTVPGNDAAAFSASADRISRKH